MCLAGVSIGSGGRLCGIVFEILATGRSYLDLSRFAMNSISANVSWQSDWANLAHMSAKSKSSSDGWISSSWWNGYARSASTNANSCPKCSRTSPPRNASADNASPFARAGVGLQSAPLVGVFRGRKSHSSTFAGSLPDITRCRFPRVATFRNRCANATSFRCRIHSGKITAKSSAQCPGGRWARAYIVRTMDRTR